MPGKDAVKTVEIMTKDLDHHINSVDKADPGSERNFWKKFYCLSNDVFSERQSR